MLQSSLPGFPFPADLLSGTPSQKNLALSVCVSPRTIHFPVSDKSPLLGLGKGFPSSNKAMDFTITLYLKVPKDYMVHL